MSLEMCTNDDLIFSLLAPHAQSRNIFHRCIQKHIHSNFCLKKNSNGTFKLDQNHPYGYQCQLQLLSLKGAIVILSFSQAVKYT